MFGFFVITVCIISLASAGGKQYVVPEHEATSSQILEHELDTQFAYDGEYDYSIDSVKGSSGAELSSIAHSSVIQAKNAVQSQHTAGSQADFGVKNSLASAALGAAQTAQAAVFGRLAITQNLKRRAFEDQQRLQEEIAQHQQLDQAASLTSDSLHEAESTVSAATALLAAAQNSAQKAQRAAAVASNAAANQQAMVEEAKQNAVQTINKLQLALRDLQETEVSASKAIEAAQIAQSNAEAAGLAVVSDSAKGQLESHQGYHYDH